jgi:hypothetical protein
VSARGEAAEWKRLLADARVARAALDEHVSTLSPDSLMADDATWRRLAQQSHTAQRRLEACIDLLQDQVAGGHAASVDRALEYLRTDPYYFRSGYARDRLVGRVAQAELTEVQRADARAYVLLCVDGVLHCGLRPLGRLARATADNAMRRELRTRLRSSDGAVRSRALRMLARVRHPGLTEADRAVAQQFVLEEAGKRFYLTRDTDRLARWLWTPAWEDDLRLLVPHHDPDRAGAKLLLAVVDSRRARRPGP